MEEKKKKNSLFKKDFTMVIIGQIISLFGNQALRFALPLYLLNETGSSTLFGFISACSFIPMIILCPIGGIIADRVNKRNIMVILDFSTTALILVFSILLGKMDIVVLMLIVMMILFGIQGAYQPAVQASIPFLVTPENIMPANAMINLVSSLAGLIGPAVGGTLFSIYGIRPILYIAIGCFLFSAIMEIFITIPFKKQKTDGSILSIGLGDLKESLHFIIKEQPAIFKVSLIIAAINLFVSSLIMIGLPVIITKSMGFTAARANQLCGFAEGGIALGSLIGGASAGFIGKKIKATASPLILFVCTLTLIPMALALNIPMPGIATYIIIFISCIFMMALATLFSVQMLGFLQILTPGNLIGKIISCAMCIGMCAQPLGQAFYGAAFQWFETRPYIPFYFATVIVCIMCVLSRGVFKDVAKAMEHADTPTTQQ